MAGELVPGQEADDADKSSPHPGIPGDENPLLRTPGSEDLLLGTPGSDDPHLHTPNALGTHYEDRAR